MQKREVILRWLAKGSWKWTRIGGGGEKGF